MAITIIVINIYYLFSHFFMVTHGEKMDEHVDLPGRRADRQIRFERMKHTWWAATEPQHDNGRQMGIHPLYITQ